MRHLMLSRIVVHETWRPEVRIGALCSISLSLDLVTKNRAVEVGNATFEISRIRTRDAIGAFAVEIQLFHLACMLMKIAKLS